MDTSKILRPSELPFKVHPICAETIEELIDALSRDDPDIDCYLMEVLGWARAQTEEEDAWIREYYVNWGWRRDPTPRPRLQPRMGVEDRTDVRYPVDRRKDVRFSGGCSHGWIR